MLLEVLPIQQRPTPEPGRQNTTGKQYLPLLLDWGVKLVDRPHVANNAPSCWRGPASTLVPLQRVDHRTVFLEADRCLSAPNSPGSGHDIMSNIFVVLQPIRTQTPALGSRFPTHQVTTVNLCHPTPCCLSSSCGEIRPLPHSLPPVCQPPPGPWVRSVPKMGSAGVPALRPEVSPGGVPASRVHTTVPIESGRPRPRPTFTVTHLLPLRVDNTQVHV